MSKKKFYVHYVENSGPKVAILNKKSEVKDFIKGFVRRYGGLDNSVNGNWIETNQIYKGIRLEVGKTYSLKKKHNKK